MHSNFSLVVVTKLNSNNSRHPVFSLSLTSSTRHCSPLLYQHMFKEDGKSKGGGCVGGGGGSISCKLQQALRICDTMQCRNLDGLPGKLSLQTGILHFPTTLVTPRDPGTPPQPPPLTLFTSLKTQAAEGFTSRKPRPQKSFTNSKDDVIYSRACYFSSGI